MDIEEQSAPEQNPQQPSSWWAQDPSREARLIDLWKAGVSTAKMAKELGCSKNAVIGKVHRLNLEFRNPEKPKPVKREVDFGGARDCRWPIGHPKEPGFHFCGAPIVPHKHSWPYCRSHLNKAVSRSKEVDKAEL